VALAYPISARTGEARHGECEKIATRSRWHATLVATMSQPNPYQSPGAPIQSSGEIRGDRERLLLVAKYQRGIMLCILASICAVVLQFILPGPLRMLAGGIGLLITIASVAFVFLLARTLYGTVGAVVFAVLTFIPCVGLLALLVVNQKATSTLRDAGLSVGLLGADLSKLQ